MTETFKLIGVIIAVIIGAILLTFVGIGAGYLFGMLIAITPFISDWLTASLPIDKAQIPGIVAWLTVLGAFVSVGKTTTSKGVD